MREFKDGDRVFLMQHPRQPYEWKRGRGEIRTIQAVGDHLVAVGVSVTGRLLRSLVLVSPLGLCRYCTPSKDGAGIDIVMSGDPEWRVFHLPPDRGRRYQRKAPYGLGDWRIVRRSNAAQVTVAGRPSHLRAMVFFMPSAYVGDAVIYEGDRAIASFMILRDGRPLYRYAGVPVYRVLPPPPPRRYWHGR